jgi:hypothetical protein
MALDPLNPFDDVDEQVQGPFEGSEYAIWYDRNGRGHRLDGPAVVYKDGRKIWMLHGTTVSPDQVAGYRRELEAERTRRLEAERARQIEAEADQFRTGSNKPFQVGHALPPFKKKKE